MTMAKIHEEIIIIKVSKLVKDSDQVAQILHNDTVSALASVAEELVDVGVIVEVERPE